MRKVKHVTVQMEVTVSVEIEANTLKAAKEEAMGMNLSDLTEFDRKVIDAESYIVELPHYQKWRF